MSDTKEILPGITVKGASICIDVSLYYSNPNAIPLQVLSRSMTGFDLMVTQAQRAIFDMLGIDGRGSSAVYLDTIRNGSKISDFVYRIFLGSDEEANATADRLHERFGVNRLMESKHVQNIVIAAIVAYALNSAISRFTPAEKAGPAIEATNSIILNAARDLNINSDAFMSMLRDGIPNPMKAGKGAVQTLQPALLNTGTVVKVGAADGVEIPAEVIERMPDPKIIETKELPTTVSFTNVTIRVMASDIDRRKQGWAIRFADGERFSENRIRAVLDATVSPADMMYHSRMKADVTVYTKPDGKPQYAMITAIHPSDN